MIEFQEGKDYGSICGQDSSIPNGARFEQGGLFFNAQKVLCDGQDLTQYKTPSKSAAVQRINAGVMDQPEVIQGLEEVDAFLAKTDDLKALKAYAKKMNTTFSDTEAEEMKVLLRAVFIAKAMYTME